eukprot:GHUV01007649.1.p1 GENE.GHUV01007649.1~~GHUV01007649.1.p1  ORF type:complete len:476 (+),score=195.64 GHUV01007649.1:1930-3357(+)
MLAKHPQLLRSLPDSTAHKLRSMAYHMYVPQGQVISMCIRQPALLSKDSEALQATLVSLQAMLQTNYQTAVTAAARAPNLLLWKPTSLRAKHELLQEVTGLLPARLNMLLLQHPGVLTLSHIQISSTLSCMQEQLQLSPADLGQILMKDPKILIRGGRVLQEQVQDLQEYLALPAAVIAKLVRRCPGILAAGSAVWLANIRTLLEVLQLNPQQVQSAVLAQPSLLQKQPSELVDAVGQLAQLVRQHQPWRDELNGLSQQQLDVVLRLQRKKLLRLAYLLDTGQHSSLHGDARLALNSALWAGKHEPQYSCWLKRQRRHAVSHREVVQPQSAAEDAAVETGSAARQHMQQLRPQQRQRQQETQKLQLQQRQRQLDKPTGRQDSSQPELRGPSMKTQQLCSRQQEQEVPLGQATSAAACLPPQAGQQQQQETAIPQPPRDSQEARQQWWLAQEQQQMQGTESVLRGSSCIAVGVPVG